MHQVRFTGDMLLAETAAEEHLARHSPGLMSRGAVVNIGRMVLVV